MKHNINLPLRGVQALFCLLAIAGVAFTLVACSEESDFVSTGSSEQALILSPRPDNKWLWVCADNYSAAPEGPSNRFGHPATFQWPQNGSREWARQMGEWLKANFPLRDAADNKAGDVAYADAFPGPACPAAAPFQPIGVTAKIDIRVLNDAPGGSLNDEVSMSYTTATGHDGATVIAGGRVQLLSAGITARRNLMPGATTAEVQYWAMCRAFGYLQGLPLHSGSDSCLGAKPTTRAQLLARSNFNAAEYENLRQSYTQGWSFGKEER